MKQSPTKHVIFTYIGDLRTRGRLLKQIQTLRNAGATCEVILGDTVGKPISEGEFPFRVRVIPVRLRGAKFKTWLDVARFNRIAARWIAASEADAACGFSLATVPACTGAKRLRPGLFVVFDSSELHVENTVGFPQHQLARLKQSRHARAVDVIQHAEANRLRYFNETYQYARLSESALIENFPAHTGPLPRKPDDVRFIYLGGLAPNRHLEQLIDAFVASGPELAIDIYGGGAADYVSSLNNRIPEGESSRIRMLGPIRNSEVSATLENYHSGFAFYQNVNMNSYWCAPNKVYDYLMAGVAVITNDYPGLKQVVEANSVGICIRDVSMKGILDAIKLVRHEKPWCNITEEIRWLFSWEGQEDTLLEIYGMK